MITKECNGNLVVCGDSFSYEVGKAVDIEKSCFRLTICDPGYGSITKEKWDVAMYHKWMTLCVQASAACATICMWGGIGKRDDRPFLQFAATVEHHFPHWQIKNWITWKKKRAYGVSDNYLFTREECLILTRGVPPFNIPLLEEKRGYPGFNAKYPAKSEYLRRTNVWTDITELFKGKIHPTQKPDPIYEVLIATHSNPLDVVFDPCCGSGTTARAAVKLGRGYCVIEREQQYLERAGLL